jgi:prephenate dehydrogenase
MAATVGIIGFGRFGQFMAEHLRTKVDIIATNRSDRSADAARLGVSYGTLAECAAQETVIVSVPISHIGPVLKECTPHFSRDALVCDVSSVKVHPCRMLERYVPEFCNKVGTHPLFGPDTAREGLAGHPVALCPLGGYDSSSMSDFIESMGLRVIETTPDEHDRQMARSLALIHYLGSALSGLDIESVTIKTATHARLCELVAITNNDSPQLLSDMHTYNPYAAEVREKVLSALHALDKRLIMQTMLSGP